MEERAACAVLKARFEAAGFRIEENRPFVGPDIEFEIDGYDPAHRVGYEYLSAEAGDGWELDRNMLARLDVLRSRGELFVLVIDESEAPDEGTLGARADAFLAEIRERLAGSSGAPPEAEEPDEPSDGIPVYTSAPYGDPAADDPLDDGTDDATVVETAGAVEPVNAVEPFNAVEPVGAAAPVGAVGAIADEVFEVRVDDGVSAGVEAFDVAIDEVDDAIDVSPAEHASYSASDVVDEEPGDDVHASYGARDDVEEPDDDVHASYGARDDVDEEPEDDADDDVDDDVDDHDDDLAAPALVATSSDAPVFVDSGPTQAVDESAIVEEQPVIAVPPPPRAAKPKQAKPPAKQAKPVAKQAKPPAKKAAARKPAKKAPAKKAPSKKTPARKPPARKPPAKNPPAKKPPAKRAPAKKRPAKKAPAKKAPAKKAPAKKPSARKPARKR